MAVHKYLIGLFLSLSLAVGSIVAKWYASSPLVQRSSGSVTQMLIGDSRRILAGFLISKADLYFHRGFYPSIFDRPDTEEDNHLAETVSGHLEHHENESAEEHARHTKPTSSLEKSRIKGDDPIARFGKHFQPAHAHMNASGGEKRELLPWLKLAIEMDPNRVEFYPVAAYWLRTELNKPLEARSLLREGLRQNPNHFLLLAELGRLYLEDQKQPDQARILLIAALKQWEIVEKSSPSPDVATRQRILISLIQLEKEENNYVTAMSYAREFKKNSPNPQAAERVIQEIEAALKPDKP